jgi:hypothetical protein
MWDRRSVLWREVVVFLFYVLVFLVSVVLFIVFFLSLGEDEGRSVSHPSEVSSVSSSDPDGTMT